MDQTENQLREQAVQERTTVLTPADRRAAATERFALATDRINDVFDAAGRVDDHLGRVSDAARSEGDTLKIASAVASATDALGVAVEELRSAALVAIEYRTKSELANDLGVSARQLFPKPERT